MIERLRKLDSSPIFREIVILAIWLLSTPPIINFFYLLARLLIVWLPVVLISHSIKWVRMLRGKPALHLPSFLIHMPAVPLLFFWAVALLGEIRLIHPLFPVIVLIAGLTTFVLHIRNRLDKRLHIAMSILLLCIVVFSGVGRLIILGAGLCVLLFLGGVFTQQTLDRIPAWTCAMAMMNILTILITLYFYLVNGRANINKIAAQPGVDVLFTYKRGDPVGQYVGEQIMFIHEGCTPDHLFIGTQYQGGGLLRYTPNTGDVVRADIVGGTSDDFVLDCEAETLIIGDFADNAVHFLDLNNWPQLIRPSLPVAEPVTRVTRSSDKTRIYALTENASLFVLNSQTGQVLDFTFGVDEWIYHPENDELTVFTEPAFDLVQMKYHPRSKRGGGIHILAQDSLNIPIFKRLNLFIIEGPGKGTVLVSDMWAGTIRVFNYEENYKFVEQHTMTVAPGIRNMLLTPDRKTLIVAGYTDGNLYFIDLETWDIIHQLHLGSRMRALALSNDNTHVYVGSSQGGFKIALRSIAQGATP